MKKNCINKLITLTILIFRLSCVSAQNNEPVTINFIPPSPTAYELGRYGQIDVGLYTGTPNISIPLHEFKTKNLSVPIVLNYNSNGIKVDQMASWVGLGWSLKAGGVITRIIRDLPDDMYDGPYIPRVEITKYNHRNLEIMEFFEDADEPTVDTEHDLFMFNFDRYSGKFVVGKGGKISIIPHQNLIIRRSPYSPSDSSGFEIITPDGTRYLFTDIEKSYLEGGCTNDIDNRFKKTAWYLSKIIHQEGDTVIFTYAVEKYKYIQGISETKTKLKSLTGYGCPGNDVQCIEGDYAICKPEMNIFGLRLKQIRSNNPVYGKVTFTAGTANPEVTEISGDTDSFMFLDGISVTDGNDRQIARFDFDYLITQKKRTFLESVTFIDVTKKYSFDYISPDALTERLSYSQDYWGYYNGIFNAVFYPRVECDPFFLDGSDRRPNGSVAKFGLLKTISYPTGGHTELQYEPNTVYEWVKQYRVVHLPAFTLDEGNNLTKSFGFTINEENLSCGFPPYESKISLRLYESSTNTCPGGTNLWINMRILDKTDNKYLLLNGSTVLTNNTPNMPVEAAVSFTNGHEYEIQLEKSEECLWGDAFVSYFTYTDTLMNNEIGGLRISRTIDYPGADMQPNIKKYYYGSMDSLNISSGNPGNKEFFITENDVIEILCRSAVINSCRQCEYTKISSNSVVPLFNMGNNNVYYRYVTISHGGDDFENGGEEHKFIINRDISGEVVLSIFAHVPENRSYSNTGWNHGLEESIQFFKKGENGNFVVLRQIHNTYKKDTSRFSEVVNYSVSTRFEPICARSPQYYVCTSEDIINQGDRCYGKSAGDTIYSTASTDHLNVIKYKDLSHWHYLDTRFESIYDLEGNEKVTTITKYLHDNPDHLLVTRKLTVSSEPRLIQTMYKYPMDYDSASRDPVLDTMISRHIINPVIEEVDLISPSDDLHSKLYEITSASAVEYKQIKKGNRDFIAPFARYSFDSADPVDTSEFNTMREDNIFSAYRKQVVYNKYDDRGNVQELNKVDDRTISYIWSYNHTYPVVKAENVDHTTLQNAVNAAMNSVNDYSTLDELTNAAIGRMSGGTGNMRSAWNEFNVALRSQPSLSNAMITTYTYDPLIGMTSQTDPAGITTYYTYDSFGRLRQTEDRNQQVMQKYNYHYRSVPGLSVSPASFDNLDASSHTGQNALKATVSANVAWTARDNKSWIYLKQASNDGDGQLIINVKSNPLTTPRSGTVTVSDAGGHGLPAQTISITQQGVTPYLNLSKNSVYFYNTDEFDIVDVTSNVSWTWTVDYYTGYYWLIVQKINVSGNNASLKIITTDAPPFGEQWHAEIEVTGGGITKYISVYISSN